MSAGNVATLCTIGPKSRSKEPRINCIHNSVVHMLLKYMYYFRLNIDLIYLALMLLYLCIGLVLVNHFLLTFEHIRTYSDFLENKYSIASGILTSTYTLSSLRLRFAIFVPLKEIVSFWENIKGF